MLVSTDGERLARFYRDLLGATETERVPAEGAPFYLGLDVLGARLGVVCDAAAPQGPQRFLLSAVLASASDVDAVLPRVTALGGTVDGAPNDMPWGQRVAHVKDPDGNALNLAGPL
ncbi:VOC family protein [Pseudonocardia sp. HH130630-07]|uniref:VOC family protein n=1 Tax=Pseudonocardia sp. HH130630-07 TaxID=1690815 RepID=UPI0008151822|nr:VOC family protein [Pseudonocardia sp. HH130630-07]ANY09735.1 extradiol dioxygenase [Pseudonocardia sp. HH130630-07]